MDNTLINQPDHRARLTALHRSSDNACVYRSLRASANLTDISTDTRCALPPGYQLIRVDEPQCQNRDVFEIALLNDLEGSVVYHSRVSISVNPQMNGRHAAHSQAWCSPNALHSAVMREVTWAVFFNYILDRFDARVLIGPENWAGMHLWQRQVSESIARGLYVYYLSPTGGQEYVPTQTALNGLVDRLWSESCEQNEHSMVISRIALCE
ncbi:hypothetical protein LZ023_04480 [Pseudomonas silvicola]|nr:hypothetical protein LZ023_04480 [Pseudomonas silvicola]